MPSYPTYLAAQQPRRSRCRLSKFSKEALEIVPADRAAGRARRAARGRQLRDDRPVLRGDRGGAQAPGRGARRGRALLRRPGAAGHRRPLLRRQRPHRHRRPTSPRRWRRSRRSSSRARACSTRRSGTATATCSIPEREEVAHYFRFQELYRRPPPRARRHAAVRADGRAVRRRLGRRLHMRPNPRSDRLPGGQRDPRADGRVQPRLLGACSTCCTRRSTAARACSRSRPARCTG